MIADGRAIARVLEKELTEKLAGAQKRTVCFILFGDDKNSGQFITMKSKVAERLGIGVDVLRYDHVTTEEAVKAVENAAKENYSGIVVQLPLPAGLDRQKILNSVPAALDIDVLSDEAKRQYVQKISKKTPPVARAVMEILGFYKIPLENKNVVIVGTGALVGEPVGTMFSLANISFQTINEQTTAEEKKRLLATADIIVSGTGVPHMIQPEMIKAGVVLIDAGTSEQAGKLAGDIDPRCAERAALFTPVPGGVGPVTVVSLFQNIFE